MEVASRYELLKLRQLPIHMTWFGCIASWASEPKLGLAWSVKRVSLISKSHAPLCSEYAHMILQIPISFVLWENIEPTIFTQ